MFLPTHLITGAIIDKAGGQDDWFKRIVIIAPVAFLSHGLLDYFNCGMFTPSRLRFGEDKSAVTCGPASVRSSVIQPSSVVFP